MEPTEHFGIYFGYIRRLFQSWVSPFKNILVRFNETHPLESQKAGGHRRLVRNRQTLIVRIVFFYWKTTWDCLARGVFSIGYRGFRHLDTLLDGSNDFDETLIEYGPGLHLPGGMGNYPRKIQLEKARRKNVLSMLKPIGFLGAVSIELFSKSALTIYFIFHYSKVPSFAYSKNFAASP